MTSAKFFIGEPRVLYVSDEGAPITGIATTSSHLYYVRYGADHVRVLDREKFDVKQNIYIPGLNEAGGLAACQHYNCLYVSDTVSKVIHRVVLSTKSVCKWSVSGEPWGISLTRKHNIFVNLCKTKSIVEYTTEGRFLRQIRLDESIYRPQDCVELSTGQLVVSHVGRTQHRVVIVDTNGATVKSYGGPRRSSTGQLKEPRGLTVDTFDNILVTDWSNDKVKVLSSKLTLLHDVTLSNHKLQYPYSVHLDEFSDRLYIGEGWWGSGNNRLFVLDRCIYLYDIPKALYSYQDDF